ncbi:MAG TPA: heme exporter protein CcmD [Stellaceae bacterium]|nr:heme exporter protein CcmD [Stellaceae bacterium]
MNWAGFFDMGGYARFVWPAYAVAAAVLLGLLAWSLGSYRRVQRELSIREEKSPRKRKAATRP